MKNFLLSVFSYRTVECFRTFLYACLYYSGLAHLLSFFVKPGAAILIYHSISDGGVFSDNALSRARFAEQIRFLKERYEIVSMSRLVMQLKSGHPISGRWVVLTFDDGYADNFKGAYPILRDSEIQGVFFPTTGVVQRQFSFFYDRIQNILERCSQPKVCLNVDGRRQCFRLGSPAAINDAALRLVLAVRNRPPENRNRFVEEVSEACGVPADVKPDIYMSEEEIRQLAQGGMEIGSHTVTHANLAGLSEPEVRAEINESKTLLEKILGRSITGFSYPFGKKTHFNDRIQALVKDAGYHYALTTVFGRVRAGADMFALPRMAARDASLVRLKVNLMGINF